MRVVASCICGSDLWPYRGIAERPGAVRIGHEFVGVVEEVGAAVSRMRIGDFVIAPFVISDGTCANCRNGVQTSCLGGGSWGVSEGGSPDAGQGRRRCGSRTPTGPSCAFPSSRTPPPSRGC